MAQSVATPTREQLDAAIRQTVLDYVESRRDGDAARMELSLHPDLAKRIVRPAEPPPAPWRPPGDWLDDMGALHLVQVTRQNVTRAGERPVARDIRILDRFENAASVKLGTDEYHHVARWNGRWVIVNVLYGLLPRAPTSSRVTLLPGQGDGDEAAITGTALDYIESCYESDAARMERSLHPDLAKRIVWPDASPSGDRLDKLSALGLVRLVRDEPDTTPMHERRSEVTILDRTDNAASVRVDASTWIDYMHIVRWNGQWAIVNVLWAVRPTRETST
jgi:hypothetical protein